MLRKFQFSFEELNIVPEDLISLLGFEDGNVPEPFPSMIEEALKDAPGICNIKGGYKIFDKVEIDLKKESITIEDQTFLPSRTVITQLKDSTSASLFICTAGHEITNHSVKISNQGDPMLGYIFDVIGSVTVEKAMDKIQKQLEIEVKESGLSISDRYSPGYCEWSVAEQQYLFALMPNDFCDVALSESSLMTPIKSVSGIIGIGPSLSQKGYQCHWCTDKTCYYGKIKRNKKRDEQRSLSIT